VHRPAPLSRVNTVALVLFLAAPGCASWPRAYGAPPCCTPAKLAAPADEVWWHLFQVTAIAPLTDSGRTLRRAMGFPVASFNLHDDAVTDSAFFTNRDIAAMSPEAVRWGPTRPDDVAVPPFTVTKLKDEGKTAGFFVKDARGVAYLFKLDPVDAPELLSGAEAVSSKLLYALGYHVPSYEAGAFAMEDFTAAPDAVMKGAHGRVAPLTPEALQALLAPRMREGRVRVGQSKILGGEILGPARFKRFRDCAEMRALKLACAWINHIDTKDHNTLLVWDGQRTVGYLIDFGTTLGADAGRAGPQRPCAGWTYIVDLKELSLETVTLGLHEPPCPVQPTFDASVGRFTSQVDPRKWKPYAPNLAFKAMTEEDAEWITARLARLSRAQIEAAVSAAQYSRPNDAAYLVETLLARRDAVVAPYVEDK